MPFTPEQPFQITEDNSLVYCLKANWDDGIPDYINDASIDVNMANRSRFGARDETRAELARAICDFLNERYPVKKD